MIENIKFRKIFIFSFLLLFLSYFITRLANLTIIPVFADEAIYIRWAQVMRAVASLRFLPLSDGKQPFFMWLIIPFLKVFPDPLFAGRMVSVVAGFGSMVGIGVLSYLFFKKKEVFLFAMVLYLISPFTFFFDRMALADGLLSCFGIWFLILTIILINKPRLDLAMIAGIILGLALITKSPALFFVFFLPLTILLLTAHKKLTWRFSIIKSRFHLLSMGKLLGLWFLIYAFAYAIYNILRLGPEFHMIAIRNKDYVFSFSEVLEHPFNPLTGHLKDVKNWYWRLLTPMVFLSGIFGIYFVIKKNFKTGIFLLLCLLLPIIGQSAIAKVYTARYVLFTVPIFLIFSAVTVENLFSNIKNKTVVIGALVLIFFFPIFQLMLLIFNPQKAWLPHEERSGYLEMWTAGYGIKETADYIKEVAKNQKVLVGTEGFFGTLPEGLQIYLEKVPNITIIGVGYPVNEIPAKLVDGKKDNKTYLLVNDTRLGIDYSNNKDLKLIKKFEKAENKQGKKESLLFLEIH